MIVPRITLALVQLHYAPGAVMKMLSPEAAKWRDRSASRFVRKLRVAQGLPVPVRTARHSTALERRPLPCHAHISCLLAIV